MGDAGYLICPFSLFFFSFFKSLDAGVVGSKSSSDEKPEFLPIYRSGSCAEIGPKQYMEDEHICVDNLIEHLGSASEIPSHGAFYGVSMFYLFLTLICTRY